ncbi:Protein of uncharacterised function (DUF2817) [Achromobacter sp. 2789STDY5608633]|uniref:DUF2817 domain-containing protein n=1 Tax=Achromobacter sp. 2789STDY5608633 TaxID=1806501 RepID=UPI0006C52698|nr:DUF2817 domain-containing protein [Achromobacter sp. 2789STDY5608633]CUJ48923.1 Protein of uncharacterised function (DUF2817) [Achromobacter sp. 2789STDY5608633]
MHQAWRAAHFSDTYQQSRKKFLAATAHCTTVTSHVMPSHTGAEGEPLVMDLAYFGRPSAARLLILSSGTHGPEGFCGSACQISLLHDQALLAEAQTGGIGVLLVHAVNPYGFSWMHRTNEHNIDLNRNAVQFPVDRPLDPRVALAQAALIPRTWPRTASEQTALDQYCKSNGGLDQLWKTLSQGQYSDSTGLFYGGKAPSWSIATLRGVLGLYACQASDVVWIDVHTGLGPYGHGEKICPGRVDDLDFVRSLWGADILVPGAGSVSGGVSGSVIKLIHEIRPNAKAAIMGLEFGTKPYRDVLDSLVADTWLRKQSNLAPAVREGISRQVRDAFYCDSDDWKGAVLGQARVVLLQSIKGLAELT